jgi:hypothetical protein
MAAVVAVAVAAAPSEMDEPKDCLYVAEELGAAVRVDPLVDASVPGLEGA